MPVSESGVRPRTGLRWLRPRKVAFVVLLAAGAFFAIGGAFDLLTDARGNLPSDHSGTLQAVAHMSWHQARFVAHPITRYITRAETAYSAFQLLFGLMLLLVVAIPLRRGERWAWWSCWLLVPGFAAFGAVYGQHDSGDLFALEGGAGWRADAALGDGDAVARTLRRIPFVTGVCPRRIAGWPGAVRKRGKGGLPRGAGGRTVCREVRR